MPEFASRDPRTPGFWDERFAQGFTPWDRGGVPQGLRDFAARASAPLVTLVPGCGSGYELAFLCDAGWDAVAIDFSPAAVETAKRAVGPWAGRVVEADFFTYAPPRTLDLVYEQAFLCAMPPALWPRVAARWAELLPRGGLLAGFFFFGESPKGPPFGIARAALDALLLPHFECVEDAEVLDSLPVFAGKERWMVWRRR
ncbi:methyltransferase domain-containing protein [Massilia sp.]|uniref:methyltransferase domain-containing protein n=1 Tax=Massilia sp. TaxID=1882437 RepID=UPI0028AEFF0D|nr:methyltransferase domain-containing protein [Massilia sp.]